jgi:hypothetical protein
LAISVVVEKVSKWKAISGAVARVAATVTATPSASARRHGPAPSRAVMLLRSEEARSRIPSTAAKLNCQPTSPPIPGSIASVTSAATASA